MENKKIAEIFQEIGDILEIKGENRFRVIAYHNASRTLMSYPRDLRKIVDENPRDLEKIPGIGDNFRRHIMCLLTSGMCGEFEEIRASIPPGLLDMLRLRGVGPKKVKLFYSELGLHDIRGLEQAAKDGAIAELPRMGEKSQNEILAAIEEHAKFDLKRTMISDALVVAEQYIGYMERCKEVAKIEYAGSLRRRKETVGDLDLLVVDNGKKGAVAKVMEHFVGYDEVYKVLAQGKTKSAVILESGLQVDLRVVAADSFGAAMHYFTGSKAHNIRVRDRAKRKGLKVNEYGVFKVSTGELITSRNEKDVFKAVGMPFIIPEIRKGGDEMDLKKMPRLIELEDLKGDLHLHSTWSDGKSKIEEIAKTYKAAGFKYFAMTDHSSFASIANGLSIKRLESQWKEIDKVNKKIRGIKILKGSEVDIMKDGRLDFPDEVLKELDMVVISAHMYPRLPKDAQTKRIIAAIENPYSKILGHPSGRLINKRGPMDLDMPKIIDACKANKVAIEINSNPLRLDLTDVYVRMAKDKGVKIVINSDGHHADKYELLKYGVFVGRRGWLTKADVLNTRDVDHLLKFWE
jgi:DNA polymerase (family X)